MCYGVNCTIFHARGKNTLYINENRAQVRFRENISLAVIDAVVHVQSMYTVIIHIVDVVKSNFTGVFLNIISIERVTSVMQ